MPCRNTAPAKGTSGRSATTTRTPSHPVLRTRIVILGLCALPFAVGCSSEDTADGLAQPLVRPTSMDRGKETTQRTTQQATQQATQRAPQSGKVTGRQRGVDDPVGGVVLDPDGHPIAGARVSLYERLRQWPRRDRVLIDSVRSGKGGRFLFARSRARGLEVEAQARNCATLVRAAPAPELGTLVVQLDRGFRVGGRVFRPDGRPASSCTVHLEPGNGSQMRAVETKTDRDGHFWFDGVPADNLRVTARHNQFQPASSEVVVIGRPMALRFEEPALVLSGRVTSGDEAVPHCRILVSPRTTNGVFYAPFEGATNSDGVFRVRGLGQGGYIVEVRHDDYSSSKRTVSLSQSRTGFEFDLSSRVKVKGQLTGVKDLVDVRLNLVSFYGETGSAEVAPDGSFEFAKEFSRGMATIELAAGPYSFEVSQSRWVGRALVKDVDELDLKIESASRITGHVHDPKGKPLAGVEVLAALKVIEDPLNFFKDPRLLVARQRVLAVTDKSGSYTIRGLEPGEVTLGFQKKRFGFFTRATHVRVGREAPASREPAVKLLPPGTISGRVTRGGQSVSGALVSLGKGLSRCFTGSDGRYTLRDLPAGQHLVRVRFRTLPIAHSEQPIELAAGQNVSDVDIPLTVGRRISGRVIDSEELPLAGMIVECPSGTSTKSDEAGRFALNVPLGRTVVHVRAEPFDPIYTIVPVGRGDDTVLVRVRQAPRSELKATVRALPRETPVVGMILRLDTDPGRISLNPAAPAQTWQNSMRIIMDLQRLNRHHVRGHVERWVEAPDGQINLQNLPAGPYTLTLHAKGYQPFVKKVTMFNGKALDLGEIKLEPGFSVEGVVVDPRGGVVPGARVVLGRESDLSLSGARTRYVADKNGRFRVEGVGLNLRNLYVSAKGWATQHHRLDLSKDILRGKKDPVRVRMQPGATIKALLVDMDGDPVPFKKVQLNRGYQRIGEAETNEQGFAEFFNVSRGSYHLYLKGKLRSLTNQAVRDTTGGKVYPVKIKDVPTKRGRRRQRR
jgi:Carboxypeptidase regulatory-like domain